MKILNFGSLNIDEVFQVKEIALPGQTISSSGLKINCGGKGLNQSIAASKAGSKVFHAGAVGKNEAEFLIGMLKSSGVDTTYVDTNHEHSGKALIQCDKNGQNCIVLYGGANLEIDKFYIDFVLKNFEKGDIILLQNEISNVKYIMEKAYEKEMKICFNPSPVNELIGTYPLEKVNILILNEIEGTDLTGEKDEEKILDQLLKRYPNMQILLTLGEKGSVYADKKTRKYQSIFDVKVVDTTAAGDTFTGYFISVLERENDVKKALCISSAASSIAVGRTGAAKSIPDLEEVEAFIKTCD